MENHRRWCCVVDFFRIPTYGVMILSPFLSMRCKRWRFFRLSYDFSGMEAQEKAMVARMGSHRVEKCCTLVLCAHEVCGRTFYLVI